MDYKLHADIDFDTIIEGWSGPSFDEAEIELTELIK